MEQPAEFVDEIFFAVKDAWIGAAGSLPKSMAGGDEPPGPGGWMQPAFASACWRCAWYLTGHEDTELGNIKIVARSRRWARPRRDWDRPPVLLTDFKQGDGRHLLWLVERNELFRNDGET